MESSQPNQSTSHFLLPNLIAGHAVPAGNPGHWKIYEKKVFEQIAKSLDFKEPGDDIKSVSALPSMWARALSMEMALHDKENKLRQAILPQWEGMLAAIALAEVRGFNLTAQLVELTAVNASGDYGRGARRFANSLEQLAPDISSNILYTLSERDKPWYDIYIFHWNERAVGATSPSTLVWPAEDGDWTGLPWWSKAEGRLRSPRGSRYITEPGERAQLWLWLDNLLRELDRHEGLESAISRMVELVRDFRDSFAPAPGQQKLLPSKKSYFGETANNRGSLIALNRPIAAQSHRSNVELVSSVGKQPARQAILVDLDQPRQWNDADPLPKQWNEKPENIWIHDTVTYGKLGTENIEQLKKGWKDQVTVLQPDDLLLPEFSYIEQEKALPGALLPAGVESLQNGEGDLITPLLPIKPILLDYFSTDDLLQMLQFERSSRGVRVTLEIPLSGTGDRPRTYRLVRDYALEEKNCKPQVPVLEIWPNLVADNWQEYYVFYSDGQAGNETFQIDLTFLAGAPKDRQHFNDNLGEHQIVRLPQFPTYINCQDSAKGNQPMGLILLPPARPTPKTNPAEWTVGVDFGTSFTTVSLNKGGQPQMLQLVSDSLSLPVTNNKRIRDKALGELFLREEIMALPLSSVLTTRGWEAEQAEIRTILDGRIYVPPNPRDFQPELKWICTGLKWSQDKKRDTFLSHLALEIVARAALDNAQKIYWAISYPSAYSQEKIQNTYNKTWRNLTEALGKATGIAQDCPKPDNPDYYRTESLALAQYFADVEKPGKDFRRATCIDLGGGTADISIWQDNTLVHQCSVKFAGRNLFSRVVELYPNLLQYFGPSEDLLGELREEKLDAKLDFLLRENSANWLKNKPDEEPCFQEFLQIMAVGLGGLYYYIGILLKVLHGETQEGKEGTKYSKPELTPVYLGGNGSRFLHWLAEGGEFDEFSLLNGLFSRMLAVGSGFTEDIPVKTTLSKEPKTEVALGLVADKKTSKLKGLESTTEEDPLIAGEVYKLQGQKCSPLTRLQLVGEEKIKQLQVVDEQELEVLPQFLYQFYLALQELRLVKVVRPLAQEVYQPSPKVEDNLSLWRDVSRQMYRYHSQVDGKTSEAEIEPPYILALKSLVDVLAQRWAIKWKRINS